MIFSTLFSLFLIAFIFICIYYDPKVDKSETQSTGCEEYEALSTIARMRAEGELKPTDPEWQ